MTVLAVAKMNKKSGITRDRIFNDWVFSLNDIEETALQVQSIHDALTDFYVGVHGGFSLMSQFSASLATGPAAIEVDYYSIAGHLNGTSHGSPVYTKPITVPSVAATTLPDQVACALSFHSDYGTDVEFGPLKTRPRARDRGRIFLGPLGSQVMDVDPTTKEPLFSAAFRTIVHDAVTALLGANVGWSTWSRKGGYIRPVQQGWIDNAPDTTRRRRNDATARTTFVHP